MSTEFIFTDEEILRQLKLLGFGDVSDEQLRVFKIELQRLVKEEVENEADRRLHRKSLSKESENEWNRHNEDTELKFTKGDAPVYRQSRHVLIEKLPRIRHTRQIRAYRNPTPPPPHVDLTQVEILPSSLTNSRSNSRSSIASVMSSAESHFSNTLGSDKDPSTNGSTAQLTRTRKRKVLRKRNGASYIYDETTCSSDVSSVCGGRRRKSVFRQSSERSGSLSGSRSERSNQLTSELHLYKKWKSTSDLASENETLRKPRSVILPYSSQSQAQSYFKTDPVALYHYYKKEWANHNIPGERDHRELRWNIRMMMSVKDVPTRSQSRMSLLSA